MKNILFLLIILALCCCNEKSKSNWDEFDDHTPKTPTTPANTALGKRLQEAGWTAVTDYGTLPEYLAVYKSPSQLLNKSAIAYIAVANLNSGASWDILPTDITYCSDANIKNYGADSLRIPTRFYNMSSAPIVVNAGLFFGAKKTDGKRFYISQNLVMRENAILAPNQDYYVEDWNNPVYQYPTLGAFIEKSKNVFSTLWTYTKDGKTYGYPVPSEEVEKVPDATYPAGGSLLTGIKGIGGVGVLIKDSVIKNTYALELLDVLSESRHPRTAIACTGEKQLVLFVCEGRQMTEGVAGFTTGEVARILLSLGCTQALNLDGGGSSCMLVNGKETIKPSDGKQRAVLTAIILK